MNKDDQHTANTANLRRRAEERLKKQPKTSPDLADATNDQRLIHELQVHQIELEMQNEELRESRAEAEAGLARYTELYDFAPTGYVTLSPEGSITLSNLATARLLGTERAKLHGQRFGLFVAVSDRAIFNNLLQEVFVGQTQSTCEVTLNIPGQPPRIVQIDATPATDDLECQAVLIDITERKRIEAALIESERFTHNTLDALSANIAILDKTGVILSVNQAWRDFAAMNSASVAGMCEGANYLQVSESTSRDDRQTVLAFANGIRTVIAGTTEEFRLEYPCHSPTEQRWFVGRATRFRDGGPLRIVVAHTNVTKRRRAEESLRESQQFLSNLVNTVDGIVWESNVETLHFSFVSQQAERILGYPVQRWLTEPTFWIDHLHPQDRDATLECCVNAIRQRKSHQFEYRMLSADGREVWLKDIVTVVLKDGVPMTLRGVMVDITAQKLAEAALRQSEAHYRLLADNSDDFVILKDTQRSYLYASPSYFRATGWTLEELQRDDCRMRVHPDDLPNFERARMANLAGETTVFEYRVRCKDGSWFWIEWRCKPLRGPEGEVQQFLIGGRDISEQQRARTVLRESERFARNTLNALPANVAILDESGVILRVNQSWRDFAATNSDNIASMCEGSNYLQVCESSTQDNQSIAQVVAAGIRAVMIGEAKDFQKEYPCHSPTEQRWFIVRVTRFAGDGPKRIVVSHFNVTEQRLAEQAVRDSEARLMGLVNTAADGIITIDKDQNVVLFNPAAEKIFQYAAADVLGKSIQKFIPERFLVALEQQLRQFEISSVSILLTDERSQVAGLRRDGSEFPAEASILKVKVGNQQFFTVIVRDISERLRSAEALRESEGRLRLILQASNIGLWDWNLATNEVFLSAEWKSQLGYSVEELSNRFEEWESRVHSEDLPHALAAISDFLEGRRGDYDVKFRLRHKNGTWRWMLTRADLRLNAIGNPIRMMGCHIDITDLQLAKEELQASRERLTVLSRQVIAVQESERQHVARELHDEIGQVLTAVALNMHHLKRICGPEANLELDMGLSLIDHAVTQVRDLSLNLRPPLLDLLGLDAAVRSCVEMHCKQTGWDVQLDLLLESRMPPELEITCYRLIQSALTNAARHAQASQVSVKLRQDDLGLELAVCDNGVGLDLDSVRMRSDQGESFGIQAMQERVQLVGGTFLIESATPQGTGTSIRAHIPLVAPVARRSHSL